jgi:hypothetical protein
MVAVDGFVRDPRSDQKRSAAAVERFTPGPAGGVEIRARTQYLQGLATGARRFRPRFPASPYR